MADKTDEEMLAWRKNVRWLCQQFIERSNAIGYRGRRRDDAALDYLIGAAQAFKVAGHDWESEAIGRICYLDVATRGFKAVERVANLVID